MDDDEKSYRLKHDVNGVDNDIDNILPIMRNFLGFCTLGVSMQDIHDDTKN